MKLQRLALWVWYRGSAFAGFQWQPEGRSVQQALEEALTPLGISTRPMPAGRTDRGVSARMQVVMVKSALEHARLREQVNAALGGDAGVALARVASEDFQPQWSATGKEYRYRLWTRGSPAPSHCHAVGAIDVGALREVMSDARRSGDFSAFHAASSPRRTRTIERAEVVERDDGIVEIRLEGDSFARFQVRLLVGTALKVAAGELSREDWRSALTHQQRIEGERAPPEGLVLWSVRYPDAVDPFTAAERDAAEGVPRTAPFD